MLAPTYRHEDLARAVLYQDLEEVRKRLVCGESPDQTWGSLSLLAYAAQMHDPELFRLLLDHGAEVPETILSEVIGWELGDWIIISEKDEDDFVEILHLIRPTKGWVSLPERRKLAERLEGYEESLAKVVSSLLEDSDASRDQE
ncbi:MAG TPA: hypothetical protein VLE43_15010 [Candidatus Saccharimonadia bacterium]|nr:hypothetical protein [Candidatus Saccharimonadia bacterium]